MEREDALSKLMIVAAIGEHRSRLYKYGIISPLLDIMTKGSASAYQNAARALMNLSAVVENKIAMFQDPLVIPSILQLLKSCSDEAMKCGLGTLYNLSMPMENKIELYHTKDFMCRMSELLHKGDTIQDRVCGVLVQLAVVDELALPMFKYKGIYNKLRSISMNKSGGSTLTGRENATGVLYHLTHCVALRIPLMKPSTGSGTGSGTGLVAGLIPILSIKGSWLLRRNILGILFHLSIPPVNKMLMFHEGVIPAVGAVLVNAHCDLESKRRGVGLLLQLSFAPDTRATLVNDSKHRIVHVLIAMLDLPPEAEECIGWAAGCLLNMAEPPEGRGTIYLAGAIPPLLKNLSHIGVEGSEASIGANLSIAVENKVPMFEVGVVQCVIQFLRDCNLTEYNRRTTTPLAQEKCIWTLGNLIRCNGIRQGMLLLGVLDAFVNGMEYGTMLCKQYATSAVMRLTDEDGNESILLAGGVIRPLVALVQCESTTNTTTNTNTNTTNNTTITDSNSTAVYKCNSVTSQDAVEALFNLCIDDSCRMEAKHRGLTREQIGWHDLF